MGLNLWRRGGSEGSSEHLSEKKVKFSLFSLYLSTLSIRVSAYMIIGVMVSREFIPISEIQRGLVIPLFSISELATVLLFGTLCDTFGRKPILISAHAIVASAGFIFLVVHDFLTMIPVMLMFGVGAAAQVSSSMSTISDHSRLYNRARLMAVYDVLTMGGLAGGYISAIILTRGAKLGFDEVFLLAGGIALASGILVILLMIETKAPRSIEMKPMQMVTQVFAQRDIHILLPVYIPVISIYGMVLSFTRTLIEEHNIQVEPDTLLLLAMIGGGLILSMLLSGYLSDKLKLRRPFIIIGLIFFGALATTLILNAGNIPALSALWPVILLLSLGAGAFPPAILGYLSDISKRETRGITFGVYSLIFGTGMIIGPILGGISLQFYGPTGFIILMFIFVSVSCSATIFMKEKLK